MSTRIIHCLPLPRVKGLSGLVEEARAFADLCLRATGQVAPTMLALTPRGLVLHGPESMRSDAEKDRFARECRLLLVATQASAFALVLESWIAAAAQGKLPKVRPSQSPARQEVVTINAESAKAQHFLLLPIHRSALGVYSGLGEDTAPAALGVVGRLTNLLPKGAVRPHDVQTALKSLEHLGVRLGDPSAGFSRC
jgi:hypothetical protein